MDLSSLQVSQDTKKMVLKSPVDGKVLVDDEGKEFYIELYSSDSVEYEKAEREMRKEARELDGLSEDSDEKVKLYGKLLSKVTADHHLIFNGEKVKDISEVFGDRSFSWIIVDVRAFIHTRKNFIAG